MTILLFCAPTIPLQHYKEYFKDLMQNFYFRREKRGLTDPTLESASKNDLLCDLDDRLGLQNRKTVDFGQPP